MMYKKGNTVEETFFDTAPFVTIGKELEIVLDIFNH